MDGKIALVLLPVFLSNFCLGQIQSLPSGTSSEILLKESFGYQKIPIQAVGSIDVELGTGNKEMDKRHGSFAGTISGEKGRELLKPMMLSHPKEPGFPAAIVTGHVTVHYSTGGTEKSRKLQIMNGRIVQDSVHPEAIYQASRTLDENWINSK